jgi:hypothetical protein
VSTLANDLKPCSFQSLNSLKMIDARQFSHQDALISTYRVCLRWLISSAAAR